MRASFCVQRRNYMVVLNELIIIFYCFLPVKNNKKGTITFFPTSFSLLILYFLDFANWKGEKNNRKFHKEKVFVSIFSSCIDYYCLKISFLRFPKLCIWLVGVFSQEAQFGQNWTEMNEYSLKQQRVVFFVVQLSLPQFQLTAAGKGLSRK